MDWKAMIQGARKVRQDVAAELAQKKAQLESLEREKASLQNAPAAKADLKGWANAYVHRAAARCATRLDANLQPLVRRPAEMSLPQTATRLLLVADGSDGDGQARARDVESLIAFAFGKDLAAAMCTAIDAMSIAEGPTLAERRVALERIEGQINRLRVEIDEIAQAAQASGLFIE